MQTPAGRISLPCTCRRLVRPLAGLALALALPWAGRAQAVVATVMTGAAPGTVAVDAVTNRVYTVNTGGTTVTVYDAGTGAVSTVTVGAAPQQVAVNPVTDKIYVTAGGGLVVIDGATAATTPVTVGSGPTAVAVNPVTNKIYVANQGDGSVSVVDGVTNAVATATVGSAPAYLAVNAATNKVYVANSGDLTLSEIDGGTLVVTPFGTGIHASSLVVNPVNGLVYVTDPAGMLDVIDGSSLVITPVAVGSAPAALAVNAATDTVYVGNSGGTTVSVVNGSTNVVTATVTVGTHPVGLAVDAAANQIYVANNGSGSVSVIDGVTNTATPVNVGTSPLRVAVNPLTGRAFVANAGGSSLSVLDGNTYLVTPVPAGVNPNAGAVDPVTDTIYVANQAGSSLTVINGATQATSTVMTGAVPVGVAVNPVTGTAYVANEMDGTVTVVNGAATATVPVGTFPRHVAVNPVSNQVYVTNEHAASVTVIDGATNATTTIPVGANPIGLAVDPVTDRIFVANSTDNTVTVINGATRATAAVPTGAGPLGVAVNPVTGTVYVGNATDGTVTVIDEATLATATVTAGSSPAGVAVDALANEVYVANNLSGNLTVIDGATNATHTVTTGPGPQGVAVDAAFHRVYVADAGGTSVTVIDGVSLATTTVTVGTTPTSALLNPVTHLVYCPDYASANVSVITPAAASAVPLAATITPLAGRVSFSSTPSFTFTAVSSFTPVVPLVDGVYYQVDSMAGAWTPAALGGLITGTLAAQPPGLHVLYAFATDPQAADAGQVGSPVTGPVTAYTFVVAPPATHFAFAGPAAAIAGAPVTVTVTAEDAAGDPVAYFPDTVALTSSDALAGLPALGPLTDGVGTFSVIFNSGGAQTVTATDPSDGLSSRSAPINVTATVAFLQAPVATQANAGATAALWATVGGSGPITYQWDLNGVPIAGATGALYLKPDAQSADAGSYTVTATNAGGTVTSAPVTLTVAATTAANPLAFVIQPGSQTVATGTTVALDAVATGATATYQWFHNGAPIVGAIGTTYVLPGATAASDGSYFCLAVGSAGAVESTAASLAVVATANPGRLVDVACRSQVGTGANQLIMGFVVGGVGTSGTAPVLVRASGPALVPFGVTGVLPDPLLTLNSPGGVFTTSGGWGGNAAIAAAAAQVGAFPWPSPASLDAATLQSFPAGGCTVEVAGAKGDTGVALAEVYDATPAATETAASPRLINLSARAAVGTGGNVLIAGFVVGGSTSKTVLIRGSGPALVAFGVPGVLADPALVLTRLNSDGTTTIIDSNTGWGGDPQIAAYAASIGAFTWGPYATPDSAVLITLPPGAYTAEISGSKGDTGVALVEVYEIP